MAELFLTSTDAMRVVESSSGATRATLFRLKVRLEDREHVDLSGGRTLDSSEGVVTVRPSVDAPDPSGWLRYLPKTRRTGSGLTPASFAAEVAIHHESFDDLLRWIAAGSLPEAVILDVDGMEHGTDPGANRKTWDVEADPKLTVRKASFIYPWKLRSGQR